MTVDNVKPISGTRKFRLFPQTLGNCIAHIAKPVLKKHGLEVELIKEWPQIVGKDIALYLQPVKFSRSRDGRGTLVVDVLQSHAVLAQHLQPLILERLAVYHGARAVERIKFQQRNSFEGMVHTPEFTPSQEQKAMLTQFEQLKERLRS